MKEFVVSYLNDSKNYYEMKSFLESKKDSKIVKMYEDINMKNLSEQVQLAKVQRCDKFTLVFDKSLNNKNFKEELENTFGQMFSKGVEVVMLNEAASNTQVTPTASKQQIKLAIINPFLTPYFNSSFTLDTNIIQNYINSVKNFIVNLKKNNIYVEDILIIDGINSTKEKTFSPNILRNISLEYLNTVFGGESNEIIDFLSDYPTTVFKDLISGVISHINFNYKVKELLPFGTAIFIDNSMLPTFKNTFKNISYYTRPTQDNQSIILGSQNKETSQVAPNLGINLLNFLKDDNTTASLVNYLNEIFDKVSTITKEEIKPTANPTPKSIEDFIVFFAKMCAQVETVKEDFEAAKKGTPLASRKTAQVRGRDAFYKNVKYNRYDNLDYFGNSLENTIIGDYFKQQMAEDPFFKATTDKINKYANFSVNGEKWASKTLERNKNKKYELQVAMGGTPEDELYDYRKYDSPDKKVDDLSSSQVWEIDNERNKIAKRIDEINKEIARLDENDPDEKKEIKKLMDEISELSEKDDELAILIDSNKATEKANQKKDSVLKDEETEEQDITDEKKIEEDKDVIKYLIYVIMSGIMNDTINKLKILLSYRT